MLFTFLILKLDHTILVKYIKCLHYQAAKM